MIPSTVSSLSMLIPHLHDIERGYSAGEKANAYISNSNVILSYDQREVVPDDD
jgi:hypothetical protein